jgi:diaminopimelate decarboxylase/aspartate kinase
MQYLDGIKQKTLLNIAEQHTPVYVYDADTLKSSIEKIQQLHAINQFFYAVKANNHPAILQQFYTASLGFECVSLAEVHYIFSLFKTISPARVIFTPNFAPRSEYEQALALGVNVTIDSLYPLENWTALFQGKNICLRLDPGQGHGHHQYVCTAGDISKFGIPLAQLSQVLAITQNNDIQVVGLHAHTGSGILNPAVWHETAIVLANISKQFPAVQYINIGGGLGITEKQEQKPIDLSNLDDLLKSVKKNYPHLKFWLEPGRFLVAASGVLLAQVTQIKTKGEKTFIGINTGMNSLIRPALYGSYHPIVNLTRLHEPACQTVDIVGPICESGDTLAFSRLMPKTDEGDILLIANVGAYGHVMSSRYNMREPAAEYYLQNKMLL